VGVAQVDDFERFSVIIAHLTVEVVDEVVVFNGIWFV